VIDSATITEFILYNVVNCKFDDIKSKPRNQNLIKRKGIASAAVKANPILIGCTTHFNQKEEGFLQIFLFP
jgi:hypothetical protein